MYTGDIHEDFINSFGGMQLLDGLFTVFKKEDIDKYNEIVADFTPRFKFEAETRVFGYNWLGVIFVHYTDTALDNMIQMVDVGDNAVYEIPCSFEDFLNIEISEYAEEILQDLFFLRFQESQAVKPIKYGECVGYKVPLFLNGEEEPHNLEVSDMDVYWTLMTQLIQQRQQVMNGD